MHIYQSKAQGSIGEGRKRTGKEEGDKDEKEGCTEKEEARRVRTK